MGDAVTAVRLAPGSGLLARRPQALLYQPVRDEQVLAAFVGCPAGEEPRAVAAATVAAGFAVGPYVCVAWRGAVHVMVYGDVAVQTDDPALSLLSGADSATWVERTLPPGGAVIVEVPGGEGPSDPDTDLGGGVAHAGGFRLELGGSPGVAVVPPADERETVSAPADPTEAVAMPAAPDGEAVDDADDPDATLPPLDAAAVLAEAAQARAARHEARVAARVCGEGHPNPPSAASCAVCGGLLGSERHTVVHVVRPSLGRLRFDDGAVVELDGELLIGRHPEAGGDPADAGRRPVRVGGAKVSRRHVAVLLREWDVLVADCASTNGTYVVAYPGGQVVGVEPGRPQLVEPGAVVYFGSRSFAVEGRGRRP